MLLNSFRRETLDDYPPRSEGKIKRYGSCTDVSAWSNEQTRRSKVLKTWIKRKPRTEPYIPLNTVLDILVNINEQADNKNKKCARSCNSNTVLKDIDQTLTKLQKTFMCNEVLIKYFDKAQIDYKSNSLKRIIMQKIDVLCQIITENISDSLHECCLTEIGGTALSEKGTQSDCSFFQDCYTLRKYANKMDSSVQFSWHVIRKDRVTQYENPGPFNILPKIKTNANKVTSFREDTATSAVNRNFTEQDYICLQKLYQTQLMNLSDLKEENGRLRRNIKEGRNVCSNLQKKVINKTKNNLITHKMLTTKTKSETEIIMEVFQNEIMENITHIEIKHKTSMPLLSETTVHKNGSVQDPLDVLFKVTDVFQTIVKKEYSKIHSTKYNNANDTQIVADVS